MEKDISEYNIEQKDTEYKESSVTKEVPIYFNILKCGRNLLDRLGVTYERAHMATQKEKCYENMLETLVDEKNNNGALLSNEKLQQTVSKVMEETEAEFECLDEITMNTSFQSPIQKKDISTINNSGYNESNYQVDTISDSKEKIDPSSNPMVDTHITNKIQKLSIRPITFEPVFIGQELVMSVQETLRDGLSQESLKPLHTISSKEIVTDAACNSVQVDRIVRTPSRATHIIPGVNI